MDLQRRRVGVHLRGGVLQASRRKHLRAWLAVGLCSTPRTTVIGGGAGLGLRSSGAQWVLATALEAAKGGAAAALPAAPPMTPLWLGQPASSPANLAWASCSQFTGSSLPC